MTLKDLFEVAADEHVDIFRTKSNGDESSPIYHGKLEDIPYRLMEQFGTTSIELVSPEWDYQKQMPFLLVRLTWCFVVGKENGRRLK